MADDFNWSSASDIARAVASGAATASGVTEATLSRIAHEGIDREMVEASLNTIEFRLRCWSHFATSFA